MFSFPWFKDAAPLYSDLHCFPRVVCSFFPLFLQIIGLLSLAAFRIFLCNIGAKQLIMMYLGIVFTCLPTGAYWAFGSIGLQFLPNLNIWRIFSISSSQLSMTTTTMMTGCLVLSHNSLMFSWCFSVFLFVLFHFRK